MNRKIRTTVILILSLLTLTSCFANVTIDTQKTMPPINPNLFGQFLEHLGQGVYGGIWAEIVRDRKFFYPVDAKNIYPVETKNFFWSSTNPACKATMDKTNPYTGQHTPALNLPGNLAAGIIQKNITFIKDKDYTGRIILAGENFTGQVQLKLTFSDNLKITETITIGKITAEYVKYPFKFTAPVDTANGSLEILSSGKGTLKIGTLSIMPADNIYGFRPDVIDLMKKLNSPIYRWPGGGFVGIFKWQESIGDIDKRPPQDRMECDPIEPGDMGIHEFIKMCQLLNAEPFLAVDSGTASTVEEIAAEVEYCNGPIDTPMGKLRAQHGSPLPYDIHYWAVGNEVYGDWQKGYMKIGPYTKKHNALVKAMKKVDPSICAVAVGHVGDWTIDMFKNCADNIDMMSEHFYTYKKDNTVDHVFAMLKDFRRFVEAHRKYRKEIPQLAGKKIPVTIDEWNYFWDEPFDFGRLGRRFYLRDALGCAAGLHELFRSTDVVDMANYAQTINVIGCIKVTPTTSFLSVTALPLIMYRHHFGTIPVTVENLPEGIDIMAAWTADKKALTIGVVNAHDQQKTINLDIKGAKLLSKGTVFQFTGQGPRDLNNVENPNNIEIQTSQAPQFKGQLTVPKLSATIFRYDCE